MNRNTLPPALFHIFKAQGPRDPHTREVIRKAAPAPTPTKAAPAPAKAAPVRKAEAPAPVPIAPAPDTVLLRKSDYDAMVAELAALRVQATARKSDASDTAALRDRLEKALVKLTEQSGELAALRMSGGSRVEKADSGPSPTARLFGVQQRPEARAYNPAIQI